MAIDTLAKRYASLTFGAAGRAGTREPAGSSSALRRTAALGGYYQEPVGIAGSAGCHVLSVRTRVVIMEPKR